MANEWIGERLRSLKKTKSGLARALGVDPARVSEIIGGRRNVQVSELPRMAEILEMPAAQLIELLTPRNNGRVPPAGSQTPSSALPPPPDSAEL
ncbi:MAG: helix-turn-helix transcriptional regulator, partial [Rhodospirillaceae bacterium]|nr:helix-turn-helix transcriptional regulator [Rhodospirillaceae bacterium]